MITGISVVGNTKHQVEVFVKGLVERMQGYPVLQHPRSGKIEIEVEGLIRVIPVDDGRIVVTVKTNEAERFQDLYLIFHICESVRNHGHQMFHRKRVQVDAAHLTHPLNVHKR